jgi:hypothetical protein
MSYDGSVDGLVMGGGGGGADRPALDVASELDRSRSTVDVDEADSEIHVVSQLSGRSVSVRACDAWVVLMDWRGGGCASRQVRTWLAVGRRRRW